MSDACAEAVQKSFFDSCQVVELVEVTCLSSTFKPFRASTCSAGTSFPQLWWALTFWRLPKQVVHEEFLPLKVECEQVSTTSEIAMGWCSSKLIVHRLWQDSFVLIANPGAPVCGYTVWKVKVDTEPLIKTDRENGMERICFARAHPRPEFRPKQQCARAPTRCRRAFDFRSSLFRVEIEEIEEKRLKKYEYDMKFMKHADLEMRHRKHAEIV